MRVGAFGGILFPLPHHVHDFVHGIELRDLVEETQFDLVLSLLVVWRSDKLSCAIDGCLDWYYYAYRTGLA